MNQKPVATIISTGTELSSGRSFDTNGPHLAQTLAAHGFLIRSIEILPDSPDILKDGILAAMVTSDVLIMTGGLGPTEDDHTIDVLCQIFEVQPVEDEKALRRVKALAARTGRIQIESARRQTRVPEGCTVIENKRGLAPGILYRSGNCTVVAMAGVPSEMKGMFETALPEILAPVELPVVYRKVCYIYGEGESSFQGKVFPEIRQNLSESFEWGITAAAGHIRIFLESANEKDISIVYDSMKKHYPVILSEPVEEILAVKLTDAGKTLALAESCTGGWIAKTITDRPGSSAYFPGGVVCYSNESKHEMLGVSAELLEEFGAVSKECAEAMAEGVRSRFHSDYGLSVTGIAGPGGGTADKPVGTVWLACTDGDRTESVMLNIPPDRERVRHYTVSGALYRLLIFTGLGA